MDELAVARWRRRLGEFPRLRLARRPTPIELIPSLTTGSSAIYVKREDLLNPAGGGNKIRKLELLLARGSGPLVTFGAVGSHHVLTTARYAAQLGRECYGILVDQPRTAAVDTTLARTIDACRGVIRLDSPIGAAESIAGSIPSVGAYMSAIGRNGIIPPGGSSPLGTLGYVDAGLELAEQIGLGAMPEPDEIYVALGTGGTAAGLALGLTLCGVRSTVVAVRVASRLTGNLTYLEILAERAFRLLSGRTAWKMPSLALRVEHGFIGAGYGRSTPEATEAVDALKDEAFPLELTYTAKAAAAVMASRRRSSRARVTLFLDTFGPMDDSVPIEEG